MQKLYATVIFELLENLSGLIEPLFFNQQSCNLVQGKGLLSISNVLAFYLENLTDLGSIHEVKYICCIMIDAPNVLSYFE